MGWEQRGGRTYYYTAERLGSRVVKHYVGAGHIAELAAQLDAANRCKRETQSEDLLLACADLDALTAALDPLDELADALTRAALIAAGFRQHHRGEWRRRREQTEGNHSGQARSASDGYSGSVRAGKTGTGR